MKYSSLKFILPCFLALSLTASVRAQDSEPDESSVEQEMAKIAELGPGVHAIQTDDKGHITSCIVVGQSRISTVLGASKGLEEARKRANLAVSAEFVKWLKQEVTVVENTEDETVTLLEGKKENEEKTTKESGKGVEISSTKISAISQALVRGLQVLHIKRDEKTMTLTVVKGWKADTSEGVKKVDSDSKREKPDSDAGTTSGSNSKDSKAKQPEKEIEDREVTSSDAGTFLPRRKSK